MLIALFILGFVVVPIAAGVVVFLRWTRADDLISRILLSLIPLAVAVQVYSLVYSVACGPLLDWNGAKLAPIVAMTYPDPTSKGHQNYALYQDPKTGVMTAWIYGPVPALIFLPAILGRSPTGMIVVGILINMLCTIGPAVWLHFQAVPPRRATSGREGELAPERFSATRGQIVAVAWLMLLTFLSICNDHESLRRALVMIGPDGPALGFLAGSCALVMTRQRGNIALALSALCAVLACWCKQSIVPFLVVTPLYLLLSDGARLAVRYVVMLGAAGVAVGAALLLAFDARNMWFHMVSISAAHHFQDNDHGNVLALWYGVGDLLADCAQSVALLMVLLTLGALSGLMPSGQSGAAPATSRALRWRRWLKANPWSLLLMTAIVLVPSSVLGYVKIGGYYNNFALTHYFLLATFTAGMIAWWPRFGSAAVAPLLRSAAAALCIAEAIAMIAPPDRMSSMYARIVNIKDNQQETIYSYTKKNPDVAYFPWNNLSTLLASGRLYHFEWGICDRKEAKIPIEQEQLLRHVPKNMVVIGFSPLHQNEYTLAEFPLFRQRVSLDELPGYTLYVDVRSVPSRSPAEQSPFRQGAGSFDLSPNYPPASPQPR